ncbi:MAG TPA: hypothetical protein VMH39_13090, partial [Gemmatimonadaceae bacterium]|nr:hypothetical protein [Gemmatimonadaceae bacterium]
TAPALAAWSSFGILAAVVVRRRNLAVALAAAAIIVPSVLVTIWTVVTGHSPPTWSLLAWAAIAPIPVHVASWRMFVERIRYVACAALVAGLLSRRWVIPDE